MGSLLSPTEDPQYLRQRAPPELRSRVQRPTQMRLLATPRQLRMEASGVSHEESLWRPGNAIVSLRRGATRDSFQETQGQICSPCVMLGTFDGLQAASHSLALTP